MLKSILTVISFLVIASTGTAQKLEPSTATLQPQVGSNSYLSISQKKVFTAEQAKSNKAALELALVITQSGNRQVLEWYNLSGKDDKIPAELRGNVTGIASLTWDKDLFEKCNSSQDLQRMTGHITNNSFVHFGSITDDVNDGVKYHCFLVQLENGKRAVLWIDKAENSYKVSIKAQ